MYVLISLSSIINEQKLNSFKPGWDQFQFPMCCAGVNYSVLQIATSHRFKNYYGTNAWLETSNYYDTINNELVFINCSIIVFTPHFFAAKS